MARIIPDIELITGGEKILARHLQRDLPPTWTVINSVRWFRDKPIAGKRTGEIDFVVVSPSQTIHVIEHTDDVAELDTEGRVVVRRAGKTQDKTRQIEANREVVIQLLREFDKGVGHRLIYSWLYVPNADICAPIPGVSSAGIIDRRSKPDPRTALSQSILATDRAEAIPAFNDNLIEFFQNTVVPTVDPTSLSDDELRFVHEFEPLSSLVLNIQCSEKIVVLEGVAGSGKTQIALTGLRRARKAGTSAVLISNSLTIPTRLVRSNQTGLPAFHYNGFKKWMDADPFQQFDQIFVEEAHQLGVDVIEHIKGYLSEAGKMFLLYDSNQDLDGRLKINDDVVMLTLNESFRVPREIADFLTGLSQIDPKIYSSREVDGSPLRIELAKDSESSVHAAVEAMNGFIEANPHLATRCAFVYGSNEYKLANFKWPRGWQRLTSEGATHAPVFDTIRRFQGLSRDFVFAAGFDDVVSGELLAQRYLYTAATRARIRVDIWLPEAWAKLI